MNLAALVAVAEDRHPRFMVSEKNLLEWPFDVISRPRPCAHCGELIALVDLRDGRWGWIGLGEVYTPERCAEVMFQRDQGVLFEAADPNGHGA